MAGACVASYRRRVAFAGKPQTVSPFEMKMRFRFIRAASAITLALILWTPVQAQVVVEYGLRIGGNTSTVVTNYITLNRRTGFQVAAFAEVLRTHAFSVQLEAEYARRGYASEQEERGPEGQFIKDVRAVTALDYLSLPVLARFRHTGQRGLTPYMLAGPRIDYLVGRSTGEWETSVGTFEDELANHFAQFSVSATIGVGAAFTAPFGGGVRLEARLTQGLSDLLWEEDTGRARNRSLELSLGITL